MSVKRIVKEIVVEVDGKEITLDEAKAMECVTQWRSRAKMYLELSDKVEEAMGKLSPSPRSVTGAIPQLYAARFLHPEHVDAVLAVLKNNPSGLKASEIKEYTGIKESACYRAINEAVSQGRVKKMVISGTNGRTYRFALRTYAFTTKANDGKLAVETASGDGADMSALRKENEENRKQMREG